MRFAGVAVGVDLDSIAKATTKKIVNRSVECPSDEIPEGEFDAADGGDGGTREGTLARKAANHHLVEFVDIVRVFADDHGAGTVYQLGNTDAPIGFTESGDAFVRLDSHQDPGEVPCHD